MFGLFLALAVAAGSAVTDDYVVADPQDAATAKSWAYYWGTAGGVTFAQVPDPASAGRTVAALRYSVSKDGGGVTAICGASRLTEGTEVLRVPLYARSGNAKFAIRVLDATGETHLFEFAGPVAGAEWKTVECPLTRPHAHWGGRNTGTVLYPAKFGVQVSCAKAGDGEVLVGRAEATLRITERNRFALRQTAGGTIWAPGAVRLAFEMTDRLGVSRTFPASYAVFDGRGECVAGGNLSVPAGTDPRKRTLAVSFTARRFGMHYLEITVRNPENGRIASRISTTAAVVTPVKGGGDRLGLNMSTATRLGSGREAFARLGYESGARWTRDEFSWERIEPVKGKYNWSETDAGVAAETAAGLKILGILGYAASWARTDSSKYTSPPKDLAAYAEFVFQVVSRYKDKVRCWEIWNEPDSPAFWPPQPDSTAYGKLLKAAYAAAKRADPGCTVLNAGLLVGMNHPDNWVFMDDLLKGDASDAFDCFAWHPYCEPAAPERGKYAERTAAVAARLKASGRDDGFWCTELGWPTEPSHGLRLTEDEQAAYLVRSHALALSNPAVRRFFWFLLRDGENREGDYEQSFGLLNPDGSPKRAFGAYCTMARFIGSAKPAGPAVVAPDANGVFRAAFVRADGKRVEVLWRVDGVSKVPLSGARAFDADGNLVEVSGGAVEVSALPVYAVRE